MGQISEAKFQGPDLRLNFRTHILESEGRGQVAW